MERDPHAILNDSPMRAALFMAVIITIALNGLDGFDVPAISFAWPGSAAAFGQAGFKPGLREPILQGNAAKLLFNA